MSEKIISLVTGGCGFIGHHLCKKLLNLGHKVVVVDNLSTGQKHNEIENPSIKYVYGDINNIECVSALFSGYQFSYVFHFAAVVGVKLTLERPLLVLEDLKGIDLLYRFSASSSVKKFFFASSSEVYGEPFSIPQNESTTPLNSRLPYAIVKNTGEAYALAYREETGLRSTNIRLFNTYGPRQRTDFVISIFIDAALSNKPIYIFGDGNQTRTFCFIEDTVNCITNLIDISMDIPSINIGSDNQLTINQVASEIIKLTNSKSQIEHLPPLPRGDTTKRQPCLKLLNSLLKEDYNFINLEDGLRKTIEYHYSILKNKL